jgi:hypothetical protein
MNIIWDRRWSGFPNSVTQRGKTILDSLRQSIGRYHGWNSGELYIGFTNNPCRRAKQHERNKPDTYEDMIVLYETSSLSNVVDVERSLIDLAQSRYLVNSRTGGGGREGPGPYYVYVLIPFQN